MSSPAPRTVADSPVPQLPLLDPPSGGNVLAPVLEALLFASPRPLTTRELLGFLRSAAENESEHIGAAALGKAREGEIHAGLVALRNRWAKEGRGVRIDETAAGWQMASAPECGAWVRELFPGERPARLSPAALETLAVIAYRQPIARAEVEAVRGVAVDGTVQTLLDRGLLRIAGRSEAPGRPILYGTTDFFLEHFGLRDLAELPNAEELKRVALPRPKEDPNLKTQAPNLEERPPVPAPRGARSPSALKFPLPAGSRFLQARRVSSPPPDMRSFSPDEPERMDLPQPVSAELERDLDALEGINRRFGGWALWNRLAARWLDPKLEDAGTRPRRILDLCTGAGDGPRYFALAARKAGVPVEILGVDAHPSTLAIAARRSAGFPRDPLPRGGRAGVPRGAGRGMGLRDVLAGAPPFLRVGRRAGASSDA